MGMGSSPKLSDCWLVSSRAGAEWRAVLSDGLAFWSDCLAELHSAQPQTLVSQPAKQATGMHTHKTNDPSAAPCKGTGAFSR